MVDKKLTACRVWIAGSSHGKRSTVIMHTILGLIDHRSLRLSLFQIHVKTAALNHETFNNAVKNSVFVKTLIDVT